MLGAGRSKNTGYGSAGGGSDVHQARVIADYSPGLCQQVYGLQEAGAARKIQTAILGFTAVNDCLRHWLVFIAADQPDLPVLFQVVICQSGEMVRWPALGGTVLSPRAQCQDWVIQDFEVKARHDIGCGPWLGSQLGSRVA